MAEYFLVRASDGEASIEQLSGEELRDKFLETEDDGAELDGRLAFKKVPTEDSNYWGDRFLIVKGSIVVPKETKVVKEWRL